MSTDPGSPKPLVTLADKIAGSANPLNIVVTRAEKIALAEELARVRLELREAGYQGRALIPIPNGHIECYDGPGLSELIAVMVFTMADGSFEHFQMFMAIDGLEILRAAIAPRKS